MIFQLNKEINNISRIPRIWLCDIGWNEENFQKLFFENLEKVLQDEGLLLTGDKLGNKVIMQFGKGNN